MSRVRNSIVTALVASGVTMVGLMLVDRGRALEATGLRSEIAELRARAAEHESSQEPAAPAPAVVVSLPAQAPSTAPALPPAPLPLPIYRNEGRATARAALQTLAWACDGGDAATVQSMLFFDAAARTKVQELFDAMPPEARGSWRTVDEMAASLLTMSGMAAPFPAADLLDQVELEVVSPDRARLLLPGIRRQGTEFQRTNDGWSYVISEAMVDNYVRQQAAGR